jgi:hypothetical protein
LFVFSVTSLTAQDSKTKKFLTKPLTIEDQGSFFIGGVPKVTNYAAAVPANAATPPVPNQITIGQMYVQFQIPARKSRGRRSSWFTGPRTPEPRSNPHPMDAKAGLRISFAREFSTYVVDQAGRGRSGSINRSSWKRQP